MDEFLKTEEEDDQPTAPFWMTTFSDMVTLLLTFFVLIVSMSEVEVVKFREALSHFQGNRSVMDFPNIVSPPNPQLDDPEEVYEEREASLEELLEFLRENNLEDKVRVNLTPDGVHVSITDSVMFRSGSADLLPTAEKILAKVAEVLTPLARTVSVEGHTDDRPIQTVKFPSNWELSGARASSVVRFFLKQPSALEPGKYETIGYAEFRPEVGNDTPEGRARNRRVEIHFSHAGE